MVAGTGVDTPEQWSGPDARLTHSGWLRPCREVRLGRGKVSLVVGEVVIPQPPVKDAHVQKSTEMSRLVNFISSWKINQDDGLGIDTSRAGVTEGKG